MWRAVKTISPARPIENAIIVLSFRIGMLVVFRFFGKRKMQPADHHKMGIEFQFTSAFTHSCELCEFWHQM